MALRRGLCHNRVGHKTYRWDISKRMNPEIAKVPRWRMGVGLGGKGPFTSHRPIECPRNLRGLLLTDSRHMKWWWKIPVTSQLYLAPFFLAYPLPSHLPHPHSNSLIPICNLLIDVCFVLIPCQCLTQWPTHKGSQQEWMMVEGDELGNWDWHIYTNMYKIDN